MVGNFLRVSSDELDQYLSDSTLLEERVYPDDGDTDDPNLLDVDKSWEGINYLLTGKTLNEMNSADTLLLSVIFGKQMLDEDQDMGYGPAQYNTSEQVREIARLLEGISVEDLRRSFDPKKMMDLQVYPTIWDDPHAFEYIEDYFIKLKEFYRSASSGNEAVLTFIN